ncbi:MAG TPA: T9SS type A sorting domain-containing protein [Bacteroidales bacterium]|nr:T9SS type A sorting domain-containing protein [Bacteroidales bacterium]
MGTDIVLTANATPALDAPHSYTYSWTSSLTGDTILGTEATLTRALTGDVTFTVVVTAHYHYTGVDAEGEPYSIDLECPATQNVFIEPDPVPVFELEVLNQVEHCNSITPGKIGISSGWDVNHTWTARLLPDGTPFEVIADTFDVTVGGTYEVKAVSVDRCEYIRTIFVDSLLVGFDAILHANTEPLDPDLDYSNDLAFCWTNTNKTIYHEVRYTNKPIFEYEYTINTPIQILQQNNQYSIVTEPGDYMLVGWVINITTGCRSKNDTLYVYAVETPEFDISPNQAICYGDEITIGIVPPTGTYDVIWTGTDLNPPTDSLEADSVTITPTIYGASTTYTAIVTVSNDHDVLPCSVTDSVIITINPLPEIAPPYVNHVSCHGGNDGRIEVYVIVGTAPFSYEWSPAAPDTNIITGLAANTYGLVITDAHGCREAMTPIVVDEPTEIIEFSRAITHVDCHGDSTGTISFVATGGTPGTTPNPAYTYYLYQGSTLIDSNNTGTFVKLPAGTYSITVEDSNKCEKVFDNFEVTQPAEPVTATLTPTNPNCYYGATGKVMANPTGGTPYLPPHDTYNYSWSNGESTQEITGLAEGWYTVTVTDSLGCVFIDSVQLVAPDSIKQSSLYVSHVDCYGNSSGKIDFVATGGTGTLTYSINATDYQPTGLFENLTAGTYTVTVKDEKDCTVPFEGIEVDQPDLLEASIAADTVHINCFGGATGAASVVVTGGTYPYNYAWSHSHADSTATGLIAGTYKVTVTDANGCIDSVEVEIRQLEMISLDTTSTVITPATCHGTNTGSITVVAQGGSGTFEYSIDGGGTYQPSGTFTNLFGDTTYTITVRDSIHNSCIDTFPGFYVPEPTKLTLDPAVITDSIKCHGGFAKVQITATGGNGGYTYTLQGHSPNNTGTFINVLAGEYKYSVVDSKGCEDTSTVKLNIPQPTQLQINTAEITDSILCHGGKANVTITATDGTPPYRYVLGTDTNTTGLFEVFAGTYSYAVIDANLCVEAPAATIVVPNPDTLYLTSASATTIACYGQFATVTITATGGTGAHIYTLEGHGNSTTGTFSNIPAGVYGYSVVDQKGCKDTSSTSLVITQPDTLIATAAVTDTIKCHGNNGEITIYATGGTRPYQFSFNANPLVNDSAFAASAGTYPYYVQDANLCITVVDSIKIEQPDPIVVTTDTTHVKCNGGNDGSLEITNVTGGVGPYTYKWSRDPLVDTTNMITGLHAGTYDVTVTDANNCDVSYSYDVNEPTAIGLTLTPTSGTTTCIYDTTKVYATVVGGTPGYSYEWTLDGDTTVIEISDTIYVTPGKYHITVTDNAGCEKVDSITINAHPVPIITSNEPPQQCDSTAFTVTAISSIAGGTWTAQLYSGVNNVEPPGLISTTDSSITYTVPGNYKDTTLYIVFEYSLTPCTYIHTTDTIKISGEPRLRIYRESTEDNYVTINQNEPTYFHFMVDDLCNASNDLRLSIDYQIYRNDTLVTTFSDYFSSANSMNFQMGLQGTGLMPPTYQPINYNLNHVSSHFPYAASNGAVLGMYQFDFFNLRFFESREGTVNINYIKEPGEYVIHFQLVTHYENSSMLQQHGNEVAVNMIGGRVGGNHFYDGTYYTKTWSTNTMTIVVNPVTSPAPLVPFTFERDVTVDPASLTVEMRIYPNPTTPNEEVKIELSNLSSTGVLTIANINGLVLEKYQLKDISKNHDLVLKVNNYAPGIYFVTYRSKEGLVTKKLVIQSR